MARKAKSHIRPAGKRVKQAQTLLQTGRRATQAVVPLAKRIPDIVGHARGAAAPVGAAGATLAATATAAQALRRARQSDPPLQRLGKKVAHTVTSIPRPHRRHAVRPRISQLTDRIPDLTDRLPGGAEALWLATLPAGIVTARRLGRARRLPIQQCLDIAVPVQVVYEEWMRLEFLPEGGHTVEKIERGEKDRLTGKIRGGAWSRKWEAEIRDERDCESFAWRSVKGSDCAGLVTFHSLGERLTRLELQLDIVPVRPVEAAEFMFHMADARARNELRRFKARLETISPDAYDLEGMS